MLSPVNARPQQSQGQNMKVFGGRNLSIKCKSRQANTTLTAYNLLESAFVNQAGNPNNLQD